ncbi:hypothetical protein J4Q44_G00038460 [Coregonus suidteri]|uniref:Uncharacterized protein n=1 Tax=Coregonus suidteri TaxID=861788 RepID=A0AAN8M885_9TELE
MSHDKKMEKSVVCRDLKTSTSLNPITTAPTETQVPLNRTTTRGSDSREKEEGDLCYASLDIRQGQRRPKKKKRVQNSDFSTYTAINTSRV